MNDQNSPWVPKCKVFPALYNVNKPSPSCFECSLQLILNDVKTVGDNNQNSASYSSHICFNQLYEVSVNHDKLT